MTFVSRSACLLALSLVWTYGSAVPASAEEIIQTTYRITLTDPATGATFASERVSERSWGSVEECERKLRDVHRSFNAMKNA